MAAGEVAAAPLAATGGRRALRGVEPLIFVLSIVSALLVWELISRTGVISSRDLPAMSTSFNELWSLVQTSNFWWSFADTVRGWFLGLLIAAVLAIPIGIGLGSSELASSAFH